MNKEQEQILSSTGRAGISRRSYARLYVNATRFSESPLEVQNNFQRLTTIGERYDALQRTIFRGVVSDQVLRHILNNNIQSQLEVALSLKEFTGDSSWFIYLAKNRKGREQITSTNVMIRETENQGKIKLSLLERLQKVVKRGYRFTDYFDESEVDQIYSLWGSTFGWRREEVVNLQRRLTSAKTKDAKERDVWLTVVRDNGNIISIAMAERLSIPAAEGNLDLVESTEWRTKEGYVGQGLMTATLIMLNAQILSDMEDRTPLIYAECNFQSRSDRAGKGAGFCIPSRDVQGKPVPQILSQNVFVGDGQPVPEGKLRDFTFMYLPKSVIEQNYNQAQLGTMNLLLNN